MIRKSGDRFSEKIMLNQRDEIMMRFACNRIVISSPRGGAEAILWKSLTASASG